MRLYSESVNLDEREEPLAFSAFLLHAIALVSVLDVTPFF